MLFIDVLTAARLEAAQAWRATYFAQSHLERHPDPQGTILNVGNAQVIYGGAELPVNRAIGLGMVDPVLPAHLEAIEEFYAVRGLPARVDLCPLADNSLITLLGERGYRVERFYTVLVTRLPSPEAGEPPGDIRITPATPGDATRWVQVVSQGFDETEQPDPETVRILSANFHAQNAYAFLAWIGDEPAGVFHGFVEEPCDVRFDLCGPFWARLVVLTEVDGADVAHPVLADHLAGQVGCCREVV